MICIVFHYTKVLNWKLPSDLHDVFQSLSEAIPVKVTQAWVTTFSHCLRLYLPECKVTTNLENLNSVITSVYSAMPVVHYTPVIAVGLLLYLKITAIPPLFWRGFERTN